MSERRERAEVQRRGDGGYLLGLARRPEEMLRVLQANLGHSVALTDLDRIAVPAGGGTRWTVPTLDGSESADAIEGVVVHWQDARAYWPGEFSGAEPPQCASEDGVRGVGDPGGSCAQCPLARFGSGRGRAQACKQFRRLLVLRPGALLPAVVSVPPTSLGEVRRYMARLTAAGRPFWSVVTRMTLEPATNRDGVRYARIRFAAARLLDDEEAEVARRYGEMFRGAALGAPTAEEVEGQETGEVR